jgi:hypothetical protein
MHDLHRALLALACMLAVTACAERGQPSPMAKPPGPVAGSSAEEVSPETVARYEEDLAAFEQQLSGCAELERLSASNPTVKVPPDCAYEHLSATCAKLRDSHAAHGALRLPASCEPYLDGG